MTVLDVVNGDLTGKDEVDNFRLRDSVREILKEIGEDPEREGLLGTPDRVARMYREIFAGVGTFPETHLLKQFETKNDNMVIVRDIPYFSACEHHLVPFFGVVHIGYVPGFVDQENEDRDKGFRVAGLSKFARVVDGFARRPQIQEKLTDEIASAIDTALNPQGVIVVVKGQHLCMSMRGVQKHDSWTITSAVYGLFANNVDGVKDEFLHLLTL